jgi:hypothetical protein
MTTIYKICEAAVGARGATPHSPDRGSSPTATSIRRRAIRLPPRRGALRHVGLVVVAVRRRNWRALKWETTRDGALFPHLYGALPPRGTLGETVAALEDGRHVFPPLMLSDPADESRAADCTWQRLGARYWA